MERPPNSSPVGRLLEELSWEGNARRYRDGGRGRENVLVAEVFQALDLLPRTAFLGEVVRRAHGDEEVLESAVREIESAVVDVLPGGPDLAPRGPNVQPDVMLLMPTSTVMVEAKRLRAGSFQAEQLAREHLVLHRDHANASRLLLLVLPAPPPIPVKGVGRMQIADAVAGALQAVHVRASDPPPLDDLLREIPRSTAWVTWEDVDSVLAEGVRKVGLSSPSVSAAIARTAASGRRAIAFHA